MNHFRAPTLVVALLILATIACGGSQDTGGARVITVVTTPTQRPTFTFTPPPQATEAPSATQAPPPTATSSPQATEPPVPTEPPPPAEALRTEAQVVKVVEGDTINVSNRRPGLPAAVHRHGLPGAWHAARGSRD